VLKQLQPTQKDIIITMGAGDIDSLLDDLKKIKTLEQV
jgi:UDP-N-acetylmuramate-alanine ligase